MTKIDAIVVNDRINAYIGYINRSKMHSRNFGVLIMTESTYKVKVHLANLLLSFYKYSTVWKKFSQYLVYTLSFKLCND